MEEKKVAATARVLDCALNKVHNGVRFETGCISETEISWKELLLLERAIVDGLWYLGRVRSAHVLLLS